MRIAVTAASGQLAQAIIEATATLVGPGNVVGIARTPSKAQGQGVEIRQGDYADQESFARARRYRRGAPGVRQ